MAQKRSDEASEKRVGIWIRVSTEDQASGDSPQHHEIRARYYAESKNWQVVEVYHLEAVSGKSVMGHAEAKRMMRDIERGHITGLIFSKLARLGRNSSELLEFANFFQKHSADLISLQESIDTSSPAGRFFYTMLAGMAHWEREEIGARVSASVAIRAKLGKPLGGKAPLGYKWTPERTFVVDPETAPLRKLIFDLFLQNRRKLRVATILNEAGHRTQAGKPFTVIAIERFLRDPVTKGTRRTNYVTHDSTKKQPGLKPESEWVYQDVEPIVSEELWNQCNAILDEQRAHKYKRPGRKAVQLFGGLTWCECGQKMYVKSNTVKYVCTRCHNKVGIEDLEGTFCELLSDYFLSPEQIGNFLVTANQEIQEKEAMVAGLIAEQAKVKKEMDQLYELYKADQIPVTSFGARNRPLDERYNQLDAEIPRLQGAIDYLKVSLLSQDKILTQTHALHVRWPTMDRELKRSVVESMVEKITITRDRTIFEFYFLPTADDPSEESDSDDDTEPPTPSKRPPFLSSRNSYIQSLDKNMATSSPHVGGWSRWPSGAGQLPPPAWGPSR